MSEEVLDPAVIQPARIAQRLRAMAKKAREGKAIDRKEFVGAILEIAADAMVAKRSYETENGLVTYDAPDRVNALKGAEMAAHLELDPKYKTEDINVDQAPDAARERLREMGYEIVKVGGPIARA